MGKEGVGRAREAIPRLIRLTFRLRSVSPLPRGQRRSEETFRADSERFGARQFNSTGFAVSHRRARSLPAGARKIASSPTP
jgi:hypothetical protein